MEAIRFSQNTLYLLDQTRLPTEEVWRSYRDYRPVAEAIRTMVVRGAPAIGCAAAYAMALAAMGFEGKPDYAEHMAQAEQVLADSRPTAVNLF